MDRSSRTSIGNTFWLCPGVLEVLGFILKKPDSLGLRKPLGCNWRSHPGCPLLVLLWVQNLQRVKSVGSEPIDKKNPQYTIPYD